MTYTARTQRGVLAFFLAIAVGSITWVDLYVQLVIALVILFCICLTFKLEMNERSLTFQVSFFNFRIYKREQTADQISHITLKRVGWTTKGAVVQIKKGMNLRISRFAPENVFEDLVGFADRNGIAVSKTKDYEVLEK
ncbi:MULTISPECIES: hypothetical protein [Pontibacillus]|uniref:Pore-forming protein n=1 Tax=Pontibacillus chungwhensis TaxID=265426 RepID=A0ABY8V075_9BACI|nr:MULTISPECIES: hypothetical protein [Pontibacillus]MCD5324350.1 hypothetical protein [Pontibacillus sp. HN14]WIF99351.1 hypothetical protein QNI29_06755 [Pontibacillus chungwhensis]